MQEMFYFRDVQSKIVYSSREEFFATYNPQQKWSLPDSIIYNIAKNPKNAKIYQKLIQSSKYFFVKNPIIVAERLCIRKDHAILNKYLNMPCVTSKFWITDKFENASKMLDLKSTPILISSFIPQLYRNDAAYLYLRGQIISYNQFMFISSNAQHIVLNETVVKDDDGSVVPLEKLVAILSKAKDIEFYDSIPSTITENTVTELLKLPHFSTIDKFEFHNIPETFDIETLFNYIKTNKYTNFVFWFGGSISEGYKNRIEAIMDEILETKDHEYKLPYFRGNEINEEKWMKVYSLYVKQKNNNL
uniref:Uncharacterized protein n=1 Tax=Panagrolaimus superbus TaxID=310955 RepID=A0A914XZI0_9BILA